MEMNTFTATITHLVNWHCADNDVKDSLINEKERGLQALSDSIADDQNRLFIFLYLSIYLSIYLFYLD